MFFVPTLGLSQYLHSHNQRQVFHYPYLLRHIHLYLFKSILLQNLVVVSSLQVNTYCWAGTEEMCFT